MLSKLLAIYRSCITVFVPQTQQAAQSGRKRRSMSVYAVAAVETKTVKIGTRGSPLALAQAYMTRDKLQAWASYHDIEGALVVRIASSGAKKGGADA